MAMRIVSIFNNKGGVGKSTLTVALAEFLASNRKKRVLVIDLDAQASCSGALVGWTRLKESRDTERTLPALIVKTAGDFDCDPADFITTRSATNARGSALGHIDVLVPDDEAIRELEETMDLARCHAIFRDTLRPSLGKHDHVFIDLPSHVDDRDTLVICGLAMSDYVLIPIEPSDPTIAALPETFRVIEFARRMGNEGRPAILGMVLNRTDKRWGTSRRLLPEIRKAAKSNELPPLFDNLLPPTPMLAKALSQTLGFRTLKERFSTTYDKVRKVALELEERCAGRTPRAAKLDAFADKVGDIFDRLSKQTEPVAAKRREAVSSTSD